MEANSQARRFPLPVKAVVFDLDGTLLDTIPDLIHAANDMLAEMELPPVSLEMAKTFIGNGMANMVKRLLTRDMHGEPDAELFQRAMPIYEKHYGLNLYRNTTIFEGVVEGLELLKAKGLPLGVVTNKVERFTAPVLEAAGLLKYFQLLVCGDTLPKKKPDPLPLLHAAEYFGVRPQEMLLIGDSPNDTRAARAAGCPVFAVPYGYSQGEDIHALQATAVVGSFVEAAELVRKA